MNVAILTQAFFFLIVSFTHSQFPLMWKTWIDWTWSSTKHRWEKHNWGQAWVELIQAPLVKISLWWSEWYTDGDMQYWYIAIREYVTPTDDTDGFYRTVQATWYRTWWPWPKCLNKTLKEMRKNPKNAANVQITSTGASSWEQCHPLRSANGDTSESESSTPKVPDHIIFPKNMPRNKKRSMLSSQLTHSRKVPRTEEDIKQP